MRSISFCGNLVLKSLRSVLRTKKEQSIFTTKIFLKYILIKEANSKTDCAKFCYKKITLIILNAKTRKTGWISAWSTQLTKGYFSKSTITFSAKLYWRTKTFWKRSITRYHKSKDITLWFALRKILTCFGNDFSSFLGWLILKKANQWSGPVWDLNPFSLKVLLSHSGTLLMCRKRRMRSWKWQSLNQYSLGWSLSKLSHSQNSKRNKRMNIKLQKGHKKFN